MSRNPERRAALAGAAIEVLASDGARGLTFRAVDAAAGLPAGTAKNYFPDRPALLRHAAEHLRDQLGLDGPTAARLRGGSGREVVANLMRAQFRHISNHRTAYLALLELRLEATRRSEIRDTLTPIVRDELAVRVDEHERSALPGTPTDAVLLYLGMLGLIVEHLTLPDALAPRDPDELLDALAARVLVTPEPRESS